MQNTKYAMNIPTIYKICDKHTYNLQNTCMPQTYLQSTKYMYATNISTIYKIPNATNTPIICGKEAH